MKRLIALLLFSSSAAMAQQSSPPALPPNLYTTPGGIPSAGGGSGGASSGVGPVINPVTTPNLSGCPAAAGTDWVTCFTSASTALDNASLIGTPSVRASTINTACTACTSQAISFSGQVGDTILVWITGANASTDQIACTDNATTSNVYRIISPNVTGNSGFMALLGTYARGVVAPFTTLTCTDNVSRSLVFIVAAVSNFGGERDMFVYNPGSVSTATLQDPSTQDANNLWLVGFQWSNASAITASASTGTLVQSVANVGGGQFGGALVSNLQTTQFSSITGAISLSSAANAQAIGIEVRSHSYAEPTLYIPASPETYNYSGGLQCFHPCVIKVEPGARMNYTGTGNAVTMGITGMTGQNYMQNFIVDGGFWTGGSAMTQGIDFKPFAIFGGVRNANFYNFGNATAYMINGEANNDDLEVGPQDRFIVDDGLVRNLVHANSAATNNNSFLRIHDNVAACWVLVVNPTSNCSAAQGGVGFRVDSNHSRVYHNNIAFFNPDIWFDDTNGNSNFGNNAEANQLESAWTTPGTILPAIQFSGTALGANNDGLLIINNSFNMHSTTANPVGPRTASDILTGSRFNFNHFVGTPVGTAIVGMNNIAGQTGNSSWQNVCLTATAGIPCGNMHTQGSNITLWNADQFPKFVFAAGTTATYTFGQASFNTVPVCTIPPNIPGTATTLTISTLNATTITITASASNSATVFGNCSASDAQ